MKDHKSVVTELGHGEILAIFDLRGLDEAEVESSVVSLGCLAHVVEHCKQTRILAPDQLDALGVVIEVGRVEGNALARIQLALEHEIEVVKMELEFLVGEVDAKLLKVVRLEHLEPKNVEDRHRNRHRVPCLVQ
jgi:hypothetical protein